MNTFPNISYTVKNNLCTGCGICEGACPTSSISMKLKNGLFVPVIDAATCIKAKGCHRCYDTCPGVGIQLKTISKKCFDDPEILSDKKVGRYLNCYTGYSNDQNIRFHSASGGMISQFLVWLLEKKHITGALVTSFNPNNEYLTQTYIVTTKEEILAARSSKYSPVTFNNLIQDMKKREGKYVVVGLPCHIHGLRKYEQTDKRFKEKIIGYFGLYCSGGRSFKMTEYVFKKKGIDKKGLTYFAYRDEGCLGSLIAKGKDTRDQKPFLIKENYLNYYPPLRSFFIPKRCFFCIDHFAELADVSFGDIHTEPYIQDKIGINSLVVRNKKFLNWLKEARQEGVISLPDLDINTLLKSQWVIFQKKQRSTTFMRLEKLLGRKVPIYDVDLKDESPLKSTISYCHVLIQIFIGKHEILCFIIDKMKKKLVKEKHINL